MTETEVLDILHKYNLVTKQTVTNNLKDYTDVYGTIRRTRANNQASSDTSSIEETLQATIQDETSTESNKYVSVRRFWNGITRFLGLANIWTALQTFNNVKVKQVYTTSQSFELTGTNPSQSINLDLGSLITIDVTGASGVATLTFTNPKEGASYWIKVLQATTKVDIDIANSGRFDGETGDVITGTNSIDLAIFLFYDGSNYFLNKSEVS